MMGLQSRSRPIGSIGIIAGTIALAVTVVGTAQAQFSYLPPGDLVPDSGTGRVDQMVYAPSMLFPMETGPAFANSQVHGHGGYLGPPGGQCDEANYSFPWRDNYCENRSWNMPLCPSGTGHQGQDIRPASCEIDKHPVVAGADGTITNVGSYSVYLTAADGTRYDYLHMSNVRVAVGEVVTAGEQLGVVSNKFGGTPTTIHLHFNIRQNLTNLGNVYVPTYMSLVTSYEKLVGSPAEGYLDGVSCDAITGWSYVPDDAANPTNVRLRFKVGTDGLEKTVVADMTREDLCEPLGSCDHGFWAPAPLSLFGGLIYTVEAETVLGNGGLGAPLEQSPKPLECDVPTLSGSVRELSDAAFAGWGFDAFWDQLPEGEGSTSGLKTGEAVPEAFQLIVDDAAENFWVIDAGSKRRVVGTADRAWRLDLANAETKTQDEIDAYPTANDLPPRPVIVSSGGKRFLIDGTPGGILPSGSGGRTTASGPGAGEFDAEADCGCRTVGGGGANRLPTSPWSLGLLVMLALGGFSRRRRGLR